MNHTPIPWEVKNLHDIYTPCGAVNAHGIKAVDNDGWHIAQAHDGYTDVKREDGSRESMQLEYDEIQANAQFVVRACNNYEKLMEAAIAMCDACSKYNLTEVIPEYEQLLEAIESAEEQSCA